MFFCESCRSRNGWPDSISKSRGACEVCGQQAVCNDVPSRHLPMPAVDAAPAGGRWDGLSQEQLTGLYMQQVDKRLIEASERMAWTALERVLNRRSGWGHLHAGGVAFERGQVVHVTAAVAYSYIGDDPVITLAYEHWHRAHLAALGARTWEASNPEESRALMSDRAPRLGSIGDDLAARLASPDPRVRGTALGDVARGWV